MGRVVLVTTHGWLITLSRGSLRCGVTTRSWKKVSIFCIARKFNKSIHPLTGNYLRDEVPGSLRNKRWERVLRPTDFAICVVVGRSLEGRVPHDALVAQDAHTPQVDLLVVRLPVDHLWREVVQRTAQRHPPATNSNLACTHPPFCLYIYIQCERKMGMQILNKHIYTASRGKD